MIFKVVNNSELGGGMTRYDIKISAGIKLWKILYAKFNEFLFYLATRHITDIGELTYVCIEQVFTVLALLMFWTR